MSANRFYKELRKRIHTRFAEGVLDGMNSHACIYHKFGYAWVRKEPGEALHQDWVALGGDFRRAVRCVKLENEEAPKQAVTHSRPAAKRVACE